jgi:hypothetical protein
VDTAFAIEESIQELLIGFTPQMDIES